MIAVMGASGNTGREVSRRLLAAGEQVRALGRSADKLAGSGAEVVAGDPYDAGYLTEAFRGADTVYVLLPHDPAAPGFHQQQDRLGEAICQAVRASGVPHVVALSAVGADAPAGTGYLASLHRQEQRLRSLERTNVLLLRSGALFENFYGVLDLIAAQGVVADSLAPDTPVPMVAARDVAAAAADALRTRDFSGVQVRELLGPRDLTYTEATRILGYRIGRPELPYVQLPGPAMVDALVQAGYDPEFAQLHVEFNAGLDDGTIRAHRTTENSTPTRFEEFAEELAAAFLATA